MALHLGVEKNEIEDSLTPPSKLLWHHDNQKTLFGAGRRHSYQSSLSTDPRRLLSYNATEEADNCITARRTKRKKKNPSTCFWRSAGFLRPPSLTARHQSRCCFVPVPYPIKSRVFPTNTKRANFVSAVPVSATSTYTGTAFPMPLLLLICVQCNNIYPGTLVIK